MKYTLITSKGTVKQFFVQELANMYKDIYGGVVITQQVLKTVDNFQVPEYN